MSTVTLSASASFGHGGKQFVARITGRHPKFTFEYQFMGRKEGKRGEGTSVAVDDPGLYITRDIDRKGRAEDSYALVYEVEGQFRKLWIAKDWAMKLAKALEANETPNWTEEGLGGEKRRAAKAEQDEVDRAAREKASRIESAKGTLADHAREGRSHCPPNAEDGTERLWDRLALVGAVGTAQPATQVIAAYRDRSPGRTDRGYIPGGRAGALQGTAARNQ